MDCSEVVFFFFWSQYIFERHRPILYGVRHILQNNFWLSISGGFRDMQNSVGVASVEIYIYMYNLGLSF
jgi:hypothetical protein